VGVHVCVGEEVRVSEAVAVGLGVGVSLGVAVNVAVGVSVGVQVGVALKVGDGVGDAKQSETLVVIVTEVDARAGPETYTAAAFEMEQGPVFESNHPTFM
jgi:hypothetical protein